MWADAGQRTEPSDTGTATDLKSADTFTANDTWAPSATTKGQRTDTEVKPGCKGAKPAKHAAKQPTLHAKRRLTMQRSNRTKCNLNTRGHQGKRLSSTVKTNSITHESQKRPNIKNNSIVRNTMALRNNSTRDLQSKQLCWTFCNLAATRPKLLHPQEQTLLIHALRRLSGRAVNLSPTKRNLAEMNRPHPHKI